MPADTTLLKPVFLMMLSILTCTTVVLAARESIYYAHVESSSVLSACPLTISKDDNLLLVVYSFLYVGCFAPSFLHENNLQ